MNWQILLAVGSGGFIGALLRFYVSQNLFHTTSVSISYATLFVNLVGSFFMGLLMAYFLHTTSLYPNAKPFILTGLLGAFTTYSTFAIESLFLLQKSEFLLFFLSITLNTFASILMAGGGFYLFKFLIKY